jgi:ABC-type Fe3+-hydroxamate transport system substrate-binding protein
MQAQQGANGAQDTPRENRDRKAALAHAVTRKALILTVAAALGIGIGIGLYRADRNFADRLPQPEAGAPHAPPKRIALLSTAAEEILTALGATDLIVGTAGYSALVEQRPDIQKIGGVMDINFEVLTRIAPDLIIAQTRDPRLERFAAERNIRFMRIDIEKTADVLALARRLGAVLGREEAGNSLAAQIEADLSAVRRQYRTSEPIPCFVTVDRSPGRLTQILTTGNSTFLNELLVSAGCRNVFNDMTARYPTVSKESLAARAPSVIIELKPTLHPAPDLEAAMKADWQLLSGIPAAAAGRIAVITHEDALIAGPKMAEVARQIARALHPESGPGTTDPDERHKDPDPQRP